jgi:hypothetical protein
MAVMASANIQLTGFPPANRDATVRLVHESTGQVIERQPFLDGSLLVRDVDPGLWSLEVHHPNVLQAIDRRTIRLFPQPMPILVPIPIAADLFRDTPIRDIPDVNLGPVQATATSARDALRPIGGKAAGEVIRSSDWNTLVGAVSDLAGAMLELTNLVSPKGHDHPEIAEKIGEVQENIRRFSDAFGRSLLELRREIESQHLRRDLDQVLDLGNANITLRETLMGRVAELETATQADTRVFTGKLATTGNVLLNAVQELAQAQGPGADDFLANPIVARLSESATQYTVAGTQSRPESELATYRRTTTVGGGSKLGNILGR